FLTHGFAGIDLSCTSSYQCNFATDLTVDAFGTLSFPATNSPGGDAGFMTVRNAGVVSAQVPISTSAQCAPTPTLTWAAPQPMDYPAVLTALQLDATASVPGTFLYTPALGTILHAGSHTLSATFLPNDLASNTTGTASVTLVVNKVTPTVSWAVPAPITYGATLSANQLNATASIP